MATLTKKKVIDPACRIGFSATESHRKRLEQYRVLLEDAHEVPYSLGEVLILIQTAWMDQDAEFVKTVKAGLTPDQAAKVEKYLGGQEG